MNSTLENTNKLLFKFMKWDAFNIQTTIDNLRAKFMNQEYVFTAPEFTIIDDQDPTVGILELCLSEIDGNKYSKKVATELIEKYLNTNTKIFTKFEHESV